MHKVTTLIPLVLFLGGCGCNDLLDKAGVCEMPKSEPAPSPYYQVGITFNKMHRDPNQACTYIANNKSTLDATFANCGSQNVNGLQAEINRIQQYCDGIFNDPADLLACDAQYGVPALKQRKTNLSAVLEVTNHLGNCTIVGCDCATFGNVFQQLVNFYNSNPPLNKTWQQLMDETLETNKQQYVCNF